jgi:pimeloyl-ACP methyl ester carboxylesterase
MDQRRFTRKKRDELRGEIQLGKISGELPATELNSEANLRLRHGVYRNASGRPIWIGPFGEFGAEHYFLDFESGRFGAIFPTKTRDVVGGPGVLQPFYPTAIQLKFGTDAGRVSARLDGKPLGKFARLETRKEEVTFSHHDIRLSGSLVSLQTKGKHPAIVLLHGSGPEDRDYLGPWVGFFSQLGMAVLSYDKRGVGKSTRDWKSARLEELADDAVSAVETLRQRPEIDAQKIGVFGISQAGWVAPIVASRVKDLRFVLLHAGGVLPPGELGLLAIEAELRAYQFPEEEIARAVAYYQLNDRVTLTGEGEEELRAAYEKNAKAEWLLKPPEPADFWFRRLYRGIYAFDPKPYWAGVSCPVLAFFGEKDCSVPAERNAAELRAALRHNAGTKIVVLPKANHLFLEAQTGVRTEYPSLRGFVPGYFAVMREWLRSIEVIGND